MKKLIAFILIIMAGSSHAALISQSHDITASGEGSIGYTFFEVTESGVFDIYTMGPTIDPVLFLFIDDGDLSTDDFIETNDDGCSSSVCGPSGAFNNSLISEISLSIGFYVAAISDFGFSTSEAISGLNINDRTGLAFIVVDTGTEGLGNARLTSVNAPQVVLFFALFLPLLFASKFKRK
ncbi:DVUA0089 family protein [Glaciecola sp. MH2013]|uniref:DVUA0089 family protein n=1 Tax=Glaciecola sp. MH2013 TaxID=2785524 RepID=UPI0018A1231E|nr:DVUA0089 family protein [Glaciecola sp. MH2013]MBF7074926.1 DVUA0089 family protein [Glaciecola sp. MH2013]